MGRFVFSHMGSSAGTMSPPLVSAEIGFEVQNALHRMLHCMDRGRPEDCETFAQLFTEEAVVRLPIAKLTRRGRSELKDLCGTLHTKFSPATHWEGNVVLSQESEGLVTNRSYWKAIKDGEIISVGIHEDSFQLVEGRWLCKERVIRHLWTKEGGDISQTYIDYLD